MAHSLGEVQGPDDLQVQALVPDGLPAPGPVPGGSLAVYCVKRVPYCAVVRHYAAARYVVLAVHLYAAVY